MLFENLLIVLRYLFFSMVFVIMFFYNWVIFGKFS